MSDAISGLGPRTDEDAVKAIFIIQPDSSPGTGFLFHDNRHILTAYHVVEGTKQNKVKVRDVSDDADTPKDYFASIQKTWEDCDIALLYLDEPIQGVQPFTLLPQTLDQNTKIRTWGFPGRFGDDWHRAEIAGGPHNRKYDIDFKVGYPDTLQGLSGGPVFLSEVNLSVDKKYSVVGIISNHGPDNLQKGKIVPTEAFYDEIDTILAKLEESDVWCYVVLSESDAEKKQKNRNTLEQAVRTALKNNPWVKDSPKRLEFGLATKLVSSPEKYKDSVKKICQARIAIFDITRFEPAVMLLLGVRSVVRRGVTIVSTGDFIIGDKFDIPFNIKELTIISHSKKQYEETIFPPEIIRDKIEDGLIQLGKLAQYLDLPVFDAVRNLPPDYRTPDSFNILILCPYSKKYQDNNWKNLEQWLRPLLPKGARIMRVLDLMSPRLVSSTIYEAIRRKDLCLVDWTEWRPNVFFELGVRLAVTGPKGFTVGIIDGKHKHLIQEIKKSTPSDEMICEWVGVNSKDPKELEDLKELKEWYLQIAEQCEYLLTLFAPLVYNTRSSTEDLADERSKELFPFDLSVYEEDMMLYYNYKEESSATSNERHGRAPDFTYEVIQSYIDIKEEPVSVPVYIDLLRTADLFGDAMDKSQTVVLYPKNKDLIYSVEDGITQRLLAAWYYLRQEKTDEEEIIKDENLFKAYQQIGLKLHDYIQETRPKLANEIDDLLEALLQKKENTHE